MGCEASRVTWSEKVSAFIVIISPDLCWSCNSIKSLNSLGVINEVSIKPLLS